MLTKGKTSEREERGLSDLLRYDHLRAPGVMRLKDGAYLAGFSFRGPDMESATAPELEGMSATISAAVRHLERGWMLHVDMIRKPAEGYPRGEFSDVTNALVDMERRMQFEAEGSHFETASFLWLAWLPPRTEQGHLRKLVDAVTGNTVQSEREVERRHEEFFETNLQNFADRVSHVLRLRRLLPREEDGVLLCEFLQGLNYVVNGAWHPVRVPRIPAHLDTMLARDLLSGEEFVYDNEYLAFVSTTGYPLDAFPGILRDLERVPIELRWSNRFIPGDFRDNAAMLKSIRKKWDQKKRPFLAQIFRQTNAPLDFDAVRMTDDSEEALTELHSGLVSFGHHTSVVVVRAPDPKSLEANVREVTKIFERQGFAVLVERRNAMEAFLGSLPGHGYENARKPMINSLNFADCTAFTSDWTGRDKSPCPYYPPDSPPLLQAASIGTTPFRLNLHVGDVGHTLIVGPTGAGKSTLLGLLVAQFDRYPNSQVFFFDKGLSAYPLAMAQRDAVHYDLGGSNSPSLCPLADLETPVDRSWAAEWIETLCTLSLKVDGAAISPRQRSLIREAIDNLAESTHESRHRTLTHFATSLQDHELRLLLEPYGLQGKGGMLLDGTETKIRYRRMNVFEIEHLLQFGPAISSPVLLYLFRQIEKRLSGQPTLLVIDEGWLALSSPIFAAKIKEWLKVLRKSNCAVVLATQSPVDVAQSSLRDVLVESCPTRILLPNPEARTEAVRALYSDMLQLNDRQLDIVTYARKKSDYYYVSPEGKRLFGLGLGPVALAFVGKTGKEDLAAIRALAEEDPETWPAAWLRRQGLAEWAEIWIRERKTRFGRDAA